MQRDISTNIRLPEEIWRAVKVRAAETGTSMKELILEGLKIVLGRSSSEMKKEGGSSSFQDLCLRYAGKAESGLTDGSVEHDRIIYDEK